MLILATAIPNVRYRWFQNINSCKINACLVDGEVCFIEKYKDHEKQLSEDTIRSLFPKDLPVKDKPLLISENLDFCSVLFRNHRRYKDHFESLVKKITPFKRTK